MKYIIILFVTIALSGKSYSQKEKEILFSFGCCFEQNDVIKVYFNDEIIYDGKAPGGYAIVGETVFKRQTIKKGAESTLRFMVISNYNTPKENIFFCTFKFNFKSLKKGSTIQFSIPKFYRIPEESDNFTEKRAVKTSMITIH